MLAMFEFVFDVFILVLSVVLFFLAQEGSYRLDLADALKDAHFCRRSASGQPGTGPLKCDIVLEWDTDGLCRWASL